MPHVYTYCAVYTAAWSVPLFAACTQSTTSEWHDRGIRISRCTIVCRASTLAGRRKQTRSPNQFILFPSILRHRFVHHLLLLHSIFLLFYSDSRVKLCCICFIVSFRIFSCLSSLFQLFFIRAIARTVSVRHTAAAATVVVVVMYTSGDHDQWWVIKHLTLSTKAQPIRFRHGIEDWTLEQHRFDRVYIVHTVRSFRFVYCPFVCLVSPIRGWPSTVHCSERLRAFVHGQIRNVWIRIS